MARLPVTIRLLDPPLHEFLPHDAKSQKELANVLGVAPTAVRLLANRATKKLRIVAEGALKTPVAWSPDGRRLAFARTARGRHGSPASATTTPTGMPSASQVRITAAWL